ncbi:restriction endonuclease subunit S [Shewanella sp. 4t3-1-2LB]|uniref:restriction endonuclease subunit S n=1 Tax=Shewanella sp. 4t3-1-2LB TaxID=2817682 RepID=UPI001A982568|nr:restriction endonuclease subunit S [Shewanella sp. 4t3-1-2LB]MBO1270839.1 restriction endonuclease subunit S [Shewanella sp. 4t3-1-2LB]
MSNISFMEKLLDGFEVEWVNLGAVADIGTGSSNRQDENENGIYPFYVRSKNILKSDTFEFDEVAIVIPGEGGIGDIFHYVEGKYALHQRAYRIHITSRKVNTKFLYHFMSSSFKQYILMKSVGATTTSIRRPMLEEFQIPIPCPENPKRSLEIQAEIVRILDAFTAMTAELTAELNLRKKQYNHYRDQLLSFEDGEVEWKTLLEACDYVDYRGKTPTKTQKGIFLVTAKNIRMGYIDYGASQEFISEDDYAVVMRRGLPKKGDVLITTEAPCGFVAQVDRENIALAQRVIKYRSKDKRLSNAFLKHYLLGGQFQEKLMRTATGSTVKGIKGSKLHQLTIPIPSDAEQARIVAILDKFDALTNSISEGLPHEIELRQKQYEYYRDLLLSFPKPKDAA